MKRNLLILTFALLATSLSAQRIMRYHYPLVGTWNFALDPQRTLTPASALDDKIELPGTTDTNGKGMEPQRKDETTHLTRLHSYVGRAWYRRTFTIPLSLKGFSYILHMERTKPSTVYVDGKEVGSSDNISTPQEYDLTPYVKLGKRQELTIMIDNSDQAVPPQVVSNSHAYTEDTQTNWNGIVGDFYIEMRPQVYVSDIFIESSAERHEIVVTAEICGKMNKDTDVEFYLAPWGSEQGILLSSSTLKKTKQQSVRVRVSLQDDGLESWSEFHPTLYRIVVRVGNSDIAEKAFGLCDFTTRGTQFCVNGNTTFLRGKHDACVFPMKGYVPTDVDEWRRYFQICKGYGINHVRFHSWCPPEQCFTAADIEGIYLQPELPFWGDFNKDDKRLMLFLMKEGQNIIRQYGHHPSFVMMALGNELWGDIPTMKTFVDLFRKMAPQKLYTFGSNYYLGYQGWKEGMDYFTTCRNGGEEWGKFNTHTRGSFSFADTYDGGLLNSSYPNSVMNFSEGIKGLTVPVISHETAQFQTYPDYREIQKYRGVLYPYNMEVFRSRLEQAGMADQADAFHKASGLWSMQLYKADIEMDLRTPGFGGFQLLDLQDYPGQGSAYVGVLDAFMESKGLITPDEFRGFCSPIVPLFEASKFCFTNDEPLTGRIQLANYAEPTGDYAWNEGHLDWLVKATDGTVLSQGSLPIAKQSHGLTDIGTISVNTAGIAKAQKVTLELRTYYNKDTQKPFTNTYPLWVFPANTVVSTKSGKDAIVVAHHVDDALFRNLDSGKSVLLMPDSTELKSLTVGGLFQTDYWNYRMFKTISENNKKPVSPGTLGLLTDPAHPIFRDFPTDMHTSWQWFPMIKASRPFMLDNTAPKYRPIVQVIDNIERNHKLGLVFEFAVGKGKLLVCMSPLDQLQQYAEARQLYSSICQYMLSADFHPQTSVTTTDLQRLFTTPVVEGKIGELNNISPY
ncbi:MAG: beta-glycosidase [Prevotella sp.]|nr:beta-glycosidase [Prevotella sp.]